MHNREKFTKMKNIANQLKNSLVTTIYCLLIVLIISNTSSASDFEIPTSPTQITPEIEELARGLDHDPKLIYEYVRNNIDYVNEFGCYNGATGTLLAGRGTDIDQTALFIALMRASGYNDIKFVYTYVWYTKERLSKLLQVSEDQVIKATDKENVPEHVRGNKILIPRCWARVNINDKIYNFDPAFKEYEHVPGFLEDKDTLNNAMGFSREEFINNLNAGIDIEDSSISNIDSSYIYEQVNQYSQNLITWIKDEYPNSSIDDILGHDKIIPETIKQNEETGENEYPTNLSSGEIFTHSDFPILTDDIVSYSCYMITITCENKVYQLYSYQLFNNRLTVCLSDGSYQLKINGIAPDYKR